MPADEFGVFGRMDASVDDGHEQVVFCRDEVTGLRLIIAIHDTTLGPALGGTRFHAYSSESEALTDVLRLSQGMTHKAAAAGLPLGGGKAVIIGDPAVLKTRELLLAYGRFIETLAGLYVTAADVGITSDDLDVIGVTTSHVVGRNTEAGGSGDSGYATALGVLGAMQAACEHRWASPSLEGRSVGVEGVGKVGAHLVGLLVGAGARVAVADPSAAACERVAASHPKVTVLASVLDADIDVYAPCAMGGTLTFDSVRKLRAEVVCGAANNQLFTKDVADLMRSRDVLWVPDYLANAGGIIQVGGELLNYTPTEVRHRIDEVAKTVGGVLTKAAGASVSTLVAAAEIVQSRLAAARRDGQRTIVEVSTATVDP